MSYIKDIIYCQGPDRILAYLLGPYSAHRRISDLVKGYEVHFIIDRAGLVFFPRKAMAGSL